MAEKKERATEGYTIAKKGYKPSIGNLATSRPPQGGSGMEPAPAPAEPNNSGNSSESGQSQSNSDD